MVEIKGKKTYINLFDNISDLADYLKKPIKEGRDNKSEDKGYDFTGTKNYQEAYDLLKYGDEELYKRVKEESMKLNFNKYLGNVSNRQQYIKNIAGFVPNIPEFLKGNPINMIDTKRNKLSHRILNIYLNSSITGGTDKEKIIENGIAYLNIIDLLEKAGYRCNVYIGNSSSYDYHTYDVHMYVKIKTDREPLNMKKICFPIAHPSFLRRIYFRWVEVFDYDLDMTDGYGRVEGEDFMKEKLKPRLKEDTIMWSFSDRNASARNFDEIVKMLEEDGIKIDINK